MSEVVDLACIALQPSLAPRRPLGPCSAVVGGSAEVRLIPPRLGPVKLPPAATLLVATTIGVVAALHLIAAMSQCTERQSTRQIGR